MNRVPRPLPHTLIALLILAAPLAAQSKAERKPLDPLGIRTLTAATKGAARITVHGATGAARFVRLEGAPSASLAPATVSATSTPQDKMAAFFAAHGRIFGIRNVAAELRLVGTQTDRVGSQHLTYQQVYGGVPVFAGLLRAHFDSAGRLRAVNGTFVPNINLIPTPTRSSDEAALTVVGKIKGEHTDVGVLSRRLVVFREGLAQGVTGANHLAWEVEVGNRRDVREFVYVDAHSGAVAGILTGINDALDRRAYDGNNLPTVPPAYPGTPYWIEGDPLPTTGACVTATGQPDCNVEATNMITASKETYDFYFKAFGRDGFDSLGTKLDSIFDRGYQCPNASWNGTFISFCPGLTTDDVTSHEWSHAYTQYTHNLIYAWQPGALNEAYSDIFGETVDLINGRGTDAPDATRSAGGCTTSTTVPPVVTINAPAAIQGGKRAGSANFGPSSFTLTNDLVLVDDGVVGRAGGTINDGCCDNGGAAADQNTFVCAPNSWPNAAALAGKIAVVNRGLCGFAVKALNAQNNGAIGVIVANNQGGTAIQGLGASGVPAIDSAITVPTLSVSQNDGTAIKAQLAIPTTVNATITRGALGTDNSVRWLLGEDANFGIVGALRDMWNPTCYGNPGKVSDLQYVCGTADNGGVHGNSGVANHGYALTVDGGTYNGQTITGLGLTKAAHIYFRAESVYQVQDSDFSDHADALKQSCTDLIGVDLANLTDGTPSGQMLTSGDCAELDKVALAIELRTPPTQCNFQPLLAKNAPALCGTGLNVTNHLFADFESGSTGWSVEHTAVTPADFTPRDWVLDSTLPDRSGTAFFAIDPDLGTCAPGGDESGVLNLTSPVINVPAGAAPRVSFTHYVATEPNFDGGNLKVSINGGPFALVPSAAYTFNPYNATMAAGGNTSPLQGQPGFTGADGGSVGGSWGDSRINVALLAGFDSNTANTLQFRYDFGNDGCGAGLHGWFVDDVRVFSCTPNVVISDVMQPEGNSGSVNAVFTISLSAASAETVSVSYSTANGSASVGDYTAAAGTVTFAPGVTTQTVTVPVAGDAAFESDETFFVNLTGASNATVTDSQGVGTIANDDALGLTAGDAVVVEGNLGRKPVTFTVTLNGPSPLPVSVRYRTNAGTARAASDYIDVSGTLTFAPGETSKTVTTAVVGDRLRESDETFFLVLSSPSNAILARGRGVATILNDD